MRGKQARKLRKLLQLKVSDPSYREVTTVEQEAHSYKLIIDGTGDENHRVEEYVNLQVISNPDRRRYRKLKKAFNNFNNELNEEIRDDLKNLPRR